MRINILKSKDCVFLAKERANKEKSIKEGQLLDSSGNIIGRKNSDRKQKWQY